MAERVQDEAKRAVRGRVVWTRVGSGYLWMFCTLFARSGNACNFCAKLVVIRMLFFLGWRFFLNRASVWING